MFDSEESSGGGGGGWKASHSSVGKVAMGVAVKAALANSTTSEAGPHAAQRRRAALTAADASPVCKKSSVRYSSVGQCVGTCESASS